MAKNDPYLEKCRQLVEDCLNWGSSAVWTNEDFENLSDKIADKTGVRLSVSTLKRIWGKVRYESSPTASTLNALARFLDCESWRDFQHKHAVAQPVAVIAPAPVPVAPVVAQEKPVAQPVYKKRGIPVTALSITALVMLAVISFFSTHKSDKPGTPPAAKFVCRKTTDGLPNSVVFDYDASAFHSDSVMIQQSWDMTRRQKIPPYGKQFTSIYYYPGYFAAKLIVDGKIVKETPVFIKTKGWKGIIKQKPVPIYLGENEIKLNDGAMGIAPATLAKKIGSPVFNDTWVEFANVREFDSVDVADFALDATVRNTSATEEAVCQKINVLVLGTMSAIIVPLCNKGCISDISVLTGYRFISGKETDLSAFGCDVKNFQHVALELQKKRLKIYLNDALILDTEQPSGIGNVVGIRFEFEGAGEIKDVKLASKGKVAYQEKF